MPRKLSDKSSAQPKRKHVVDTSPESRKRERARRDRLFDMDYDEIDAEVARIMKRPKGAEKLLCALIKKVKSEQSR